MLWSGTSCSWLFMFCIMQWSGGKSRGSWTRQNNQALEENTENSPCPFLILGVCGKPKTCVVSGNRRNRCNRWIASPRRSHCNRWIDSSSGEAGNAGDAKKAGDAGGASSALDFGLDSALGYGIFRGVNNHFAIHHQDTSGKSGDSPQAGTVPDFPPLCLSGKTILCDSVVPSGGC